MIQQIRFAQPGDGAGIFRLIHELAEFEKLESQVTGSAAELENDLFGDSPACRALVVSEEDEIVAYALFFGTYSSFRTQPGIYLEDLYVTPRLRGKGIGKKLLGKLAEITVERGGGRLEWSVLDWNQPAIDFYESMNAAAQSEWTMYRLTGPALYELAGRAL